MFENAYNIIQETKVCPICSRPFTAHPTKRYCSRRCKNKAKNERTKITELSPQSTIIHQRELLKPTIEEMDLLCKNLPFSDEIIYKIRVLPPGWVCPPDVACTHRVYSSNPSKNCYEVYAGGGGFTVVQEDISLERRQELQRQYDEATHRKYEEEKLARMRKVKAALATNTPIKEELATIELLDGTRKENLTMTELDQFCGEHSYNKVNNDLIDITGTVEGKIIYHE